MHVDELGCMLVHHHPGSQKNPEQPGGDVRLKDECNVYTLLVLYM